MNTTEKTAYPQTVGMDASRKVILGLGAILVLVVIGMYIWKTAAVGAVADQLAQAQAQQAQAHAQLLDQARQLDARRGEEALSRFSIPFAWVIRREVMAANLDQVDQYFTDLVKMEGFQAAVLAQPDGRIVVASDRKKLADAFSSLYPAQYLQADAIKIDHAANGGLRAIIPIMGLNQHLATLVLEYTPPAYPLQ